MLKALQLNAGKPLTVKDIVRISGAPEGSVRDYLHKLKKAGAVTAGGQTPTPPPVVPPVKPPVKPPVVKPPPSPKPDLGKVKGYRITAGPDSRLPKPKPGSYNDKILTVLKDQRGAPLSVKEIIKRSGAPEGSVRDYLGKLKRKGLVSTGVQVITPPSQPVIPPSLIKPPQVAKSSRKSGEVKYTAEELEIIEDYQEQLKGWQYDLNKGPRLAIGEVASFRANRTRSQIEAILAKQRGESTTRLHTGDKQVTVSDFKKRVLDIGKERIEAQKNLEELRKIPFRRMSVAQQNEWGRLTALSSKKYAEDDRRKFTKLLIEMRGESNRHTIDNSSVYLASTAEAMPWLRRAIRAKVPTHVNQRLLPYGERRAYNKDGTSHLSAQDDAGISIHEFCHSLEENNPLLHQRALQFIAKRIKPGEGKQDLGELGTTMHGEFAYADEFNKATGYYAGKTYNEGQTEIITMGVELMWRDPVRFAHRDPEYFEFIAREVMGMLPD